MQSKILSLLEENNQLLKEIRDILKEITSKEYREKEDLKSLAINLLADVLVEYKSDELHNIIRSNFNYGRK